MVRKMPFRALKHAILQGERACIAKRRGPDLTESYIKGENNLTVDSHRRCMNEWRRVRK